jgi:ABC-2 type transport system permease protein
LALKTLRDVLAVAGNEFRQFRRNRTAILLSLVVLPLFFTVSLGAAGGGATTTFSPTAKIPVAFIDNDLSSDSSRLLQEIRSSGDFDNIVLGYREDSALAVLGTGEIYAAIVVPEGFHTQLENNQTTHVILYTDDGEPGVGDSVSSVLSSIVQDFNPKVEVQAERRGLTQVEIVQKGALFSSFNVGLVVVLGVVQIFATFYEIAGGMSREREEGTFARMLVSPTGIVPIMLGKTVFDSLLAIIRTFIVLGLAVFMFGARPSTDLVTLVTVSLIIAIVTMGFGFLVSSLKVGARAVVIVEFFLVLFLFAFSGLIIDKELLRGVSQVISNLLPWDYGFDILRRTVLIGRPLLSLGNDLGIIFAATIVFYAASYAIFRMTRERLVF